MKKFEKKQTKVNLHREGAHSIRYNFQCGDEMYSVSKKYADFQQNLFWKHKDPRCIQDEVMSYRGIKFLEKIDRKAVPQQQQQT